MFDKLQDPEFMKKAQEFKMDSIEEIKDRSSALKLNSVIGDIAKSGYKIGFMVGALSALQNFNPFIFKLTLGAIVISIIAGVLNAYQAYRVEKKMEEEYEKFVKHMNDNGFDL